MKQSESKTSLAELNPEDPTCFICLDHENELAEPVVSSKLLRTCGCHFVVHPHCWNEWMKDKTDYDCPICRKKSIFSDRHPTPLNEFLAAAAEIPTQSNNLIFIVFSILGIITIILITLFVIFSKKND